MEKGLILDIGAGSVEVIDYYIEEQEQLKLNRQQRIAGSSEQTILDYVKAGLSSTGFDPQQLSKCYLLIPESLHGEKTTESLPELEEELTSVAEGLAGISRPEFMVIKERQEAFRTIGQHLKQQVGSCLIIEVRESITVFTNWQGTFLLTESNNAIANSSMTKETGNERTSDKQTSDKQTSNGRTGGLRTNDLRTNGSGETAETIAKVTQQMTEAVAGALTNHFHQIFNSQSSNQYSNQSLSSSQSSNQILGMSSSKQNQSSSESSQGCKALKFDWIIGTGGALVELPNALQVLENGIKQLVEVGHPLSCGDVPILIDSMKVIPAVGVLALDYPAGSWGLLMESLSIDS